MQDNLSYSTCNHFSLTQSHFNFNSILNKLQNQITNINSVYLQQQFQAFQQSNISPFTLLEIYICNYNFINIFKTINSLIHYHLQILGVIILLHFNTNIFNSAELHNSTTNISRAYLQCSSCNIQNGSTRTTLKLQLQLPFDYNSLLTVIQTQHNQTNHTHLHF